MDTLLFKSKIGEVRTSHIKSALHAVGAANCDVLYIHTDMTFGLPAIKRGQLLEELLNIIEGLGVKTLVFPTFTFSFCNDEPFDIQNSRTFMGALNEYARKTGRGVRSHDPLLSVYVLGDPLNLTDNLSAYSIGKDSNYDRLHNCSREVKFLFFGADMRACFTYGHYMEAIIGIPYRYDRLFTGTIIDNGVEYPNQERYLYTTYANVRLNPIPVVYEAMLAKKQLRTCSIGDTALCCFKEKEAFATIAELIHTNPLCMTDGTYDHSIKDTTYTKEARIISVR